MMPPGWYLSMSCSALSTPYSSWFIFTSAGACVSALVP
jgi:hypothetical protein